MRDLALGATRHWLHLDSPVSLLGGVMVGTARPSSLTVHDLNSGRPSTRPMAARAANDYRHPHAPTPRLEWLLPARALYPPRSSPVSSFRYPRRPLFPAFLSVGRYCSWAFSRAQPVIPPCSLMARSHTSGPCPVSLSFFILFSPAPPFFFSSSSPATDADFRLNRHFDCSFQRRWAATDLRQRRLLRRQL